MHVLTFAAGRARVRSRRAIAVESVPALDATAAVHAGLRGAMRLLCVTRRSHGPCKNRKLRVYRFSSRFHARDDKALLRPGFLSSFLPVNGALEMARNILELDKGRVSSRVGVFMELFLTVFGRLFVGGINASNTRGENGINKYIERGVL